MEIKVKGNRHTELQQEPHPKAIITTLFQSQE